MSDAIAILPARGGSQRIPRKNIRLFCGKPVIEYSIEAARESGCFRRIVVSTDDDETLEIAKKAGAGTFWRSSKYATAHAIMADAVIEVLRTLKKGGYMFDYGCVIYPAAPFLTADRLREGLAAMPKHGSVCMVWRGPHVERALKIEGDHLVSRFAKNDNINSNEWSDSYYHAGQAWWFDAGRLMRYGTLMLDPVGAIVVDRNEAVDIDTMEDWKWAERLYVLQHPTVVKERLEAEFHERHRAAAGLDSGMLDQLEVMRDSALE